MVSGEEWQRWVRGPLTIVASSAFGFLEDQLGHVLTGFRMAWL